MRGAEVLRMGNVLVFMGEMFCGQHLLVFQGIFGTRVHWENQEKQSG
jgi:hypothetical protein